MLKKPHYLIVCIILISLPMYFSYNQYYLMIFTSLSTSLMIITYLFFTLGKEKKRRVRDVLFLIGTGAIVIMLSAYGYFYVYVNEISIAKVPNHILEKNSWTYDESRRLSVSSYYGLFRMEIVGYEFAGYESPGPPYPGGMIVASIKTIYILDEETIENEITRRLDDMSSKGLVIDKNSKVESEEKLNNSKTAKYIIWDAEMKTKGSGYMDAFVDGAKLKIKAEYWVCDEKGMVVVAVGYAQVGYIYTSPWWEKIISEGVKKEDELSTWNSIRTLMYYIEC